MWKKGALVEVNVLKQCAFKVSWSGSLRVMGAGGAPVLGIYGVTVRRKREKKSLIVFFGSKTFEDYECLKEYRVEPV